MLAAGVLQSGFGAETSGLAEEFRSPPDARKPYVMWYWMKGSISKEGVKADLDG